MNDADEEDELRLLLEHVVPHVGAPAERMRQVRQRVSRRKRRRAALVAAAASGLTAVAVCVTLLRPSVSGEDTALPAPAAPPSHSGLPVPGEGTFRPDPGGSSPNRAGGPAVNLSDVGLTLTLPDGWQAGTGFEAQSMVADFAANQPMAAQPSCPDATSSVFACVPLSSLADGGALIAFLQTDTPHERGGKETFAVDHVTRPGNGCRGIGGDLSLTGWGVAHRTGKQRFAVNAYACLRDPSDATLDDVRKLLATAVSSDIGAVGSPGGRDAAGAAGVGSGQWAEPHDPAVPGALTATRTNQREKSDRYSLVIS